MAKEMNTTVAPTRQRAVNFFALLGILGGHRAAKEAWDRAGGVVDLTRPLASGAGAAIGRLDVDDNAIERAVRQVDENLVLQPDDRILELGRDGYPALLAGIAEPPQFLFVRGRTDLLDAPGIAVVGTRKPSQDGGIRARKLAYLLARRGIVVLSGLAIGIDTSAHMGALDSGGDTVAVIGTPLTTAYPAENESLQLRIGQVGAVVSQFCPGFGTTRGSFPIRNATMSGLALGTVVIEASETSGALIQARRCLEQGRKLFIPQSALDNPSLLWPRKFVQQGAIVFRTFKELTESLERERLISLSERFEPALANVGGANAD